MVRQEQSGGPAFTGSFADLLARTGGKPGQPAADQAARDTEKARLDKAQARAAYIAELQETRWAAWHLNFPENRSGIGPWASEHMGVGDKLAGWSTPFSDTEAEKRVKTAQGQNGVRRQVRDAFNAGQTWEQIRAILSAANPDTRPRDLDIHYGVSDTAPATGDIQLSFLGFKIGPPIPRR
jgi:hypothetical protein